MIPACYESARAGLHRLDAQRRVNRADMQHAVRSLEAERERSRRLARGTRHAHGSGAAAALATVVLHRRRYLLIGRWWCVLAGGAVLTAATAACRALLESGDYLLDGRRAPAHVGVGVALHGRGNLSVCRSRAT